MTLITEKDAATKRCQEGFAPPHSMMDSYVATTSVAQYVSGSYATMTSQTFSPLYCIGSRCMAWRFATETNEFAQRIGYCGKVGKP